MIEQIAKLDALSPLKTLARGYGIVTKEKRMVKSIAQLQIGDNVLLTLSDGTLPAEIK